MMTLWMTNILLFPQKEAGEELIEGGKQKRDPLGAGLRPQQHAHVCAHVYRKVVHMCTHGCVYRSVVSMCARVYSACARVGRAGETPVSVAVRSWVQNLRSLAGNEGGDRHRRGEGRVLCYRQEGGRHPRASVGVWPAPGPRA